MFAWIKSLFSSKEECCHVCHGSMTLSDMESMIITLMINDGFVTKDSFFAATGMKLYWLQKCAKSMKEKGYKVTQERKTIEIHKGHMGGCQVHWYFTK